MSSGKPTRKRASPKPENPPDEVVRIAKAEGPTKFQQMRKFLIKANENDKPLDLLAEFLPSKSVKSASSRRKSGEYHSPASVGRFSMGSPGSPNDFHTGLTPTASSQKRGPFPPAPVFSRRESDESFAASDLLLNDGKGADNRLGTFIHGQRAVSLRQKSNRKIDTVTPLLLEDIVNVGEILAQNGKVQIRKQVLENTAEEEEDVCNDQLNDSQLDEDDFVVG